MFLYRFKNFICVVAAVAFSLLVAVGVKTVNVSRLSAIQGKRTFFLDSASSQGLMRTELSLSDLGRVKGECVSFSLETYVGGRYASNEDIVQEIVQKFNAEILLIEDVAGVTSYYCYTPLWQDGLFIEGEKINLHVAISKEQCSVGTPIIFGGF